MFLVYQSVLSRLEYHPKKIIQSALIVEREIQFLVNHNTVRSRKNKSQID